MTVHLLYVCDARPEIGMGHLARALGVLGEVRRRAPGLAVVLSGRFSEGARAFLQRRLPEGVGMVDEDDASWTCRVAALDTMAVPGDPAALDVERAERLGRRCGTLALVSSSMEVATSSAIGLLIDHMPEVRIRGPVPRRCLFGLQYAPVAPEVAQVAPVPAETSERLLAVIGGSARQTGPRLLAELLAREGTGRFRRLEMIVSPHFPPEELEALRERFPAWTFEQNVPSVAERMARAGAVICTYGNATYESLALGRPTLVFGYSAFQREYADFLETRGLVASCGLFDAPRRDRLAVLGSGPELARLAAAARASGVGCGIRNIAKVLCEEVDGVQDT